MKKLLILIPLILQIFLVAKDEKALALSKRCQTEARSACLTIEILAIANKNPEELIPLFAEFSTLLKNGALTDDPRLFSPITHELGMELVFKKMPIAEAFAQCPLNFKAACLHGAVMESLDPLPLENPEDFFHFCDFTKNKPFEYANCIHGVGHELAAKSTASLNETLQMCSTLSARQKHACLTGIFMEFSTGIHGTGSHTHEVSAGTILLPCSEIDTVYQSVCYVSMSAYRQYSQNTEPFPLTAQSCLAVPIEFQNNCILGLAEKIFTASGENTEKASTLCDTLDQKQIESCKASVRAIKKLESVL